MILNHTDRHSATWQKIKQWAEEEINFLRIKNDGALDELTTASIRGEIRALKKLVAVEIPPPDLADD